MPSAHDAQYPSAAIGFWIPQRVLVHHDCVYRFVFLLGRDANNLVNENASRHVFTTDDELLECDLRCLWRLYRSDDQPQERPYEHV